MQPDGAILGGILAFVCLILVVVLVLVILYLLTLQKALNRVSPRNRLMEPAMVWLLLVPCVNFVWQFFVAIRVPESLRNEFRDRGEDDGSDYGKSIGITMGVLNIVGSVISNVGNTMTQNRGGGGAIFSGIGGLLSLVAFVLFIVFWVKIAGYSRRLAEEGGPRRRRDEYDDDDDDDDRDLPRRPRKGDTSEEFREGGPDQYR